MNRAKSNCCSQLVCLLYHLSPESGLVLFQIPAATVVIQVVLGKENNVAGRSEVEVDGASKLGHGCSIECCELLQLIAMSSD